MERYKKELSKQKYDPIPQQEEIILFQEFKNGSELAKQKLINANLRFSFSIANNFINKGIPFADIVSQANIGLLNALNSFEVSKGCKFITYAVYHIKQAIYDEFYKNSRLIRLPTAIIKKIETEEYIPAIILSWYEDEEDNFDEIISDDYELNYFDIDELSTEEKIWKIVEYECLNQKHPLDKYGNLYLFEILKKVFTEKEDKKTFEEIGKMLHCSKQNVSYHFNHILKSLEKNMELKKIWDSII